MRSLFNPTVIGAMDRIVQLIAEEELQPGAPLPSVKELSQLLLFPEDLTSRALLQLFYDGTLDGNPEEGQYLVAPSRLVFNAWGWPSNNHSSGGLPSLSFANALSLSVVEASKVVSNALNLPLGSSVYCLRQLWKSEEGICVLITSYLSENRFPQLQKYALSSRSLYDVLEQEYGIEADNKFLDFLIGTPTEEDCQLLHLAPRELLMILSCQTLSQFGDVFEYSVYKNPSRSTCYRSSPVLRGST